MLFELIVACLQVSADQNIIKGRAEPPAPGGGAYFSSVAAASIFKLVGLPGFADLTGRAQVFPLHAMPTSQPSASIAQGDLLQWCGVEEMTAPAPPAQVLTACADSDRPLFAAAFGGAGVAVRHPPPPRTQAPPPSSQTPHRTGRRDFMCRFPVRCVARSKKAGDGGGAGGKDAQGEERACDGELLNQGGLYRPATCRLRTRRFARTRTRPTTPMTGVVRDSNSGHQLLLPPANCFPMFASRTTQAPADAVDGVGFHSGGRRQPDFRRGSVSRNLSLSSVSPIFRRLCLCTCVVLCRRLCLYTASTPCRCLARISAEHARPLVVAPLVAAPSPCLRCSVPV